MSERTSQRQDPQTSFGLPDGAAIRLGVSACLVGQPVRFDGGHQRSRFLVDELAPYAELIPVCPEMGIGLGTPRESLRLVLDSEAPGAGPRLVAPRSARDHTEAMQRWARAEARRLQSLDLDGFVLKRASPSCGMERVKLYRVVNGRTTGAEKIASGLFAEQLMARLPELPIEEEGRLNDAFLRERFVTRVFAHHRLRRFFAGPWRVRDLIEFHRGEKLLLSVYDPAEHKRLGRLVAAAAEHEHDGLADEYRRGFMRALSKSASRARHAHVMHRMRSFMRPHLDAEEREELREIIDDFREGLVPRVVPVTLLRHHIRKHRIPYLAQQAYLRTHPKALGLSNYV